jgi:hypothetical protein
MPTPEGTMVPNQLRGNISDAGKVVRRNFVRVLTGCDTLIEPTVTNIASITRAARYAEAAVASTTPSDQTSTPCRRPELR